MSTIIEHFNESFLRVDTSDRGLLRDISEYFCFFANNYRWHPAFKAKRWDGRIRLFNVNSRLLPRGLLSRLIEFFEDSEVSFTVSDNLNTNNIVTSADIENFYTNVQFISRGVPIQPRDFQPAALEFILNKRRGIIESPTGSGKSYIIASLYKYLTINKLSKKTLIVVPNLTLLSQMFSDISEYFVEDKHFDPEESVHLLYSGQDKNTQKELIISTYQSLMKVHESWFTDIDCLIIDEAHGAESKEITKIAQNCVNATFKAGFTGSLKDGKVHRVTLEGLFGEVFTTITTKELIDRDEATKVFIKPIILKYPEELCKSLVKLKYPEESKFIETLDKRNKFIAKMVHMLQGNTLLMFDKIEHGEVLRDLIEKELEGTGRNVYFIKGTVSKDDRELVRTKLYTETNAVVLATISIFSTGVNIPTLNNIVQAFSTKSKTRVLQSIGRLLRKHESKDITNYYDIVDYIKYKKKEGYAVKHFAERMDIYRSQKHPVKVKEINLFKG